VSAAIVFGLSHLQAMLLFALVISIGVRLLEPPATIERIKSHRVVALPLFC